MPRADSEIEQPNLRERLKIEEENSTTPSVRPKSTSVFDSIYHDSRRIASFLAQFQTYGTLGSTKATTFTSRQESEKKQGVGTAGFPGVVGGSVSYEQQAGTASNDAAEQTFDPLWRNALNFLNHLEQEDLIERNLPDSRLGQFVLLQGSLIVIDPILLQNSWDKPALKSQLRLALGSSGSANKKKEDNLFNLFIEVLKIIPHSAQCYLMTKVAGVWASLDAQCLIGSSADILLKNGALVSGQWSLLGVMDAFADFALFPDENGNPKNFDELIQGMIEAPIPKMMAALAPMARQLIGRPKNFYGVTPLLIFREISRKGEEQPNIG